MGLFTLAVQKSEETLYSDACDLLQKGITVNVYIVSYLFCVVVSVRPGLLHAWVLLTTCYLKMQLFDEALVAASKADKLLKSINNSNSILRCILDKLRLEILSHSDDKGKLSEAIEIGENVRVM